MRRPVRGLVRPLPAAALALGLVAGLAACGDPGQSYCAAIAKDQTQLTAMISSTSPDALFTDLPLLESLAAKSPEDLTDEWQTFLNAITGLRDALGRAGLKASEFKGNGIPTSVQGQRRRNLIAAADTLSSQAVVDAANGIETQARDVCHVNLGL